MNQFLRMRRLIAISVVLVVFCVSFVYCVYPVFAEEGPKQKVIKVGCVDIEQFLMMDKNGNVHGYGEEYLSAINSKFRLDLVNK